MTHTHTTEVLLYFSRKPMNIVKHKISFVNTFTNNQETITQQQPHAKSSEPLFRELGFKTIPSMTSSEINTPTLCHTNREQRTRNKRRVRFTSTDNKVE